MAESVEKDHLVLHRRSYRRKGYDYSLEAAYFVTIGTCQRICFFGEILDGVLQVSQYGRIATDQWLILSKRFRGSDFSVFSIMPNHIHGIIVIASGAGVEFEDYRAGCFPLRPYKEMQVVPGSLSAIVRSYKASVTFRINCLRGSSGLPIWQRNYYDHIIRNDKEYDNIEKYIRTNPLTWNDDQYNPRGLGK